MNSRSWFIAQYVRLRAGPASGALRRRLAGLGRRLGRRPHEVLAFLQLDDPYSYLLSLYLPALAEEYDVAVQPCLAAALIDGYVPEPALQAEYAIEDCRRLARELGVPFLDRGDMPVVEHRRGLADVLAAEPGSNALVYRALAAYWRGDSEGVARLVGRTDGSGAGRELVEAGRARLDRMGHYDCATLYYEGEWYRGVDRLGVLADRLRACGLRRPPAGPSSIAGVQQAARYSLPASPPRRGRQLPPVELFHSFRSPYSYLGLVRAAAVADAFGLELVIRPVLPLVMRGRPMPRRKLLDIVRDARREAARHGIPLRHFRDPGSNGIERLMAAFDYAAGERRERAFALAAGRAIWNDGLDVGNDRVLRGIAEEACLFWPEVLASLADDAWRNRAAANREALTAAGLWGVPSFLFDNVALWGQDRVWLLVREIEERCQDGEGILE